MSTQPYHLCTPLTTVNIYVVTQTFPIRIISVMAPTKPTAVESKRRNREFDTDDLKKLFDTKPDDYEIAWNELKHRIIGLNEHERPTIHVVNFSQYLYHWFDRTHILIACAVDALAS